MWKNEGPVDRFVRVFAGVLLLSFFFFGPKTMWGLMGLLPLLTGAFGYCPFYTVLGLDTCATTKSSAR